MFELRLDFISWKLNSILKIINSYFKSFGEYDLLYYNAMFTIIPMFLLSFYSGEIEKVNKKEH
jgi:hypothetical protein